MQEIAKRTTYSCCMIGNKQKSRLYTKNLQTLVQFIGYHQSSLLVYTQVSRVLEHAWLGAFLSETTKEFAVSCKEWYPMVPTLWYYDVPLFINGDTKWEEELSGSMPLLSKSAEWLPIWGEPPNAMVASVSNNHLTTLIDCDPSWVLERCCDICRTKIAHVLSTFIENVDAGFVPVWDQDFTIKWDGYSPWFSKVGSS